MIDGKEVFNEMLKRDNPPTNEWLGKSKTDIEAELNQWLLDEAILTKEKVKQLLNQHSAHLVERLRKEKDNLPPYPHEGAHGQAVTLAAQRGYQDGIDQAVDIVKTTNK